MGANAAMAAGEQVSMESASQQAHTVLFQMSDERLQRDSQEQSAVPVGGLGGSSSRSRRRTSSANSSASARDLEFSRRHELMLTDGDCGERHDWRSCHSLGDCLS